MRCRGCSFEGQTWFVAVTPQDLCTTVSVRILSISCDLSNQLYECHQFPSIYPNLKPWIEDAQHHHVFPNVSLFYHQLLQSSLSPSSISVERFRSAGNDEMLAYTIDQSVVYRGKLYLHSYSNFTEPIIETAPHPKLPRFPIFYFNTALNQEGMSCGGSCFRDYLLSDLQDWGSAPRAVL